MSGYFGALIEQLGFGGILGFCVGYFSKKVAKTLVLLVGFLFICVQLLAHYHWVTPHWDAVAESAQHAAKSGAVDNAFGAFMKLLLENIPFGAAFVAGFWLGMKKG